MTSSEYTQCLAYLKQGAALVVAVFLSWLGVHKEGEWLKEKNTTPLHPPRCTLRWHTKRQKQW